MGKKKQPFYRIVAIDSRVARDGKYIEKVGHYNPIINPPEIVINDDDDNLLVRIEEAGDNTNIMSARDADEDGESRYDFVTTGVVHIIDKVIDK